MGYVNSNPAEAFDAWFNASLAVIQVPLDEQVWHLGQAVHHAALQCARDIIAGWSMVFTNTHAARCILLQGSGGVGTTTTYKDMTDEADKAAAVKRAKSIAARVEAILTKINSEYQDRNKSIASLFHQVAAMIHYRLTEYKVPVDFEALLKLKGIPAQLHRSCAVPFAEGTIKKGFILTNQEAQQVMTAASPHR